MKKSIFLTLLIGLSFFAPNQKAQALFGIGEGRITIEDPGNREELEDPRNTPPRVIRVERPNRNPIVIKKPILIRPSIPTVPSAVPNNDNVFRIFKRPIPTIETSETLPTEVRITVVSITDRGPIAFRAFSSRTGIMHRCWSTCLVPRERNEDNYAIFADGYYRDGASAVRDSEVELRPKP
ncbi:MAG: hypothetical protein AAGA46_03440 [Cyanobacteria bacterium P01_F01_bin.13]